MTLLTLPNAQALATSIRATAQVFEDPASRALLSRIRRVAPSDASVLIMGETGTGKELIARHVHALSARADGPFVAVNCGAFSENLVEAELFGNEKGAFTGAFAAKEGWFEAANGGTLFLDEIGDLPLAIQVKLLRVLQEREVVRLGARKPVPIDVRIVAATNVQLEQAIAAGRFREDLFYRLNVVRLELPPLRDRPGDILPLAHFFIRLYQSRLGYERIRIDARAEDKLRRHAWPGNIRELENVIHHTLLVCRDGEIRPDDLQLARLDSLSAPAATEAVPVALPPMAPSTGLALLEQAFDALCAEEGREGLFEEIETAILRFAYARSQDNQVHTARLLGLSRSVTRARLIRAGLLSVRERGPQG